MFNQADIVSDFPILQKKIHDNQRLVYLDNGATSQKPVVMIETMSNYYLNHNANVHRGIHQLGDESTKLFHQARQTIANFFGAQPAELLIVRNTTEAINQVAYTWGEMKIGVGDVIVTTEMEHHSNIVPWQELAKRKQAILKYVSVDAAGRLELASLEKILRDDGDRVKLVCFTHVSNALGTLNPVEKMIALIKKNTPAAKIVIDGAQAAPHLPINFDQLGADFYAVSAHKMLGPMGIGALLVKPELLSELPPFLFGGGMINEVHLQDTSFAEDIEERFTAGTPDVASLVGWAAACDYLKKIGMNELAVYDQKLVAETIRQLQQFPQINIVGLTEPADLAERVGSVAFIYEGVHAHDVGQILDSAGVAVRSGHHCTMPLHQKFHWQATVRVSFQLYNSADDIAMLVAALNKVKHVFGK